MTGAARAVVAVRRLRVPAAVAYDAWLDAAVARRWLFATATAPNVAVDIDARIGGAFRCVACEPGGQVAYVGRYVELLRPHRLAFTLWRGMTDAAPATVAVDIAPAGAGCRVTVAQRGIAQDAAARAQARRRWIGMLHGFAEILDDVEVDARWRRRPPLRAAARPPNHNVEPKETTWITC